MHSGHSFGGLSAGLGGLVAVEPRVIATSGRDKWPLIIGSRYLQQADGAPFLVHGDTPWAIEVQLTRAQVDTYLSTRYGQGFTAILFELCEHKFSSNSPVWRNAEGNDPFSSVAAGSVTWQTPTEAYWQMVDYIIAEAKSRGMVCFVTPAYLGFGGGTGSPSDEGWMGAVTAASDANLQSYGTFLGQRYGGYGNVVWVAGGDYAGTATERDKQWNIFNKIIEEDPDAIVTGHQARTNADAYTYWGAGGQGYAGFNLNSIYGAADGSDGYSEAATAYGRSGPLPFFMIEAGYEGERTLAEVRRAAYQSMLSGACGHFFGNNPIWGFGEPNFNGGAGPAASLSSLTSTGAQQMGYLKALLTAYEWHLLTPKTDTSLVSGSLGSGTGRICPASYTSEGRTVALIYSPAVDITLVMTAFAQSSVRVRLFDPTAGTYSTVGTYSNTGTQSVTVAAESVVVCD